MEDPTLIDVDIKEEKWYHERETARLTRQVGTYRCLQWAYIYPYVYIACIAVTTTALIFLENERVRVALFFVSLCLVSILCVAMSDKDAVRRERETHVAVMNSLLDKKVKLWCDKNNASL